MLLLGFFSACGVDGVKFNADRICILYIYMCCEVNRPAMTLLFNLASMHLYLACGHGSLVCSADAKARVGELLTRIHLATGGEGITAVSLGATARGDVVAHLAIGIHSTSSTAGIDAFSVSAHLRVAALIVVQATASMTIGQRISLVPWWTRAHRTAADGFLATCTGSARITRTSLGWTEALMEYGIIGLGRSQDTGYLDTRPRCGQMDRTGLVQVLRLYYW